MKDRSFIAGSFRIVLPYAVFGALWILFSDRVLLIFRRNPDTMLFVSTAKGWLFIIVTAVLLYALISREFRRRAELEVRLREGLADKEALLAEVHHRVKNNLQVVASILNLERDGIIGEEGRLLADRTRARIRSMALVHERIYESAGFARIDLVSYLRSLPQAMTEIYAAPAARFDFSLEDVDVGADIAVPFGLFAAEAVTNALRHGIRAEGKGEISITLRDLGEGSAELLIRDNGPGFPDPLVPGLGLGLMEALASQLGGRFSLTNERGALVHLIFPASGGDRGEHLGRTTTSSSITPNMS